MPTHVARDARRRAALCPASDSLNDARELMPINCRSRRTEESRNTSEVPLNALLMAHLSATPVARVWQA